MTTEGDNIIIHKSELGGITEKIFDRYMKLIVDHDSLKRMVERLNLIESNENANNIADKQHYISKFN